MDLGWLYKATKKYYGREGQQSIDPVVFFKLILVGYLENLNSDRKIIEHSKLRLDILFFLGYDLDERLQTPYAKKMKKLRQSTVEPVLGTLINFTGLRRIWTRGIKNANKCMLGAAIAYNLKKWMNYQEHKTKTAVMVMKKLNERLYSLLLMLCDFTTHHNIQSSKQVPHLLK